MQKIKGEEINEIFMEFLQEISDNDEDLFNSIKESLVEIALSQEHLFKFVLSNHEEVGPMKVVFLMFFLVFIMKAMHFEKIEEKLTLETIEEKKKENDELFEIIMQSPDRKKLLYEKFINNYHQGPLFFHILQMLEETENYKKFPLKLSVDEYLRFVYVIKTVIDCMDTIEFSK